MGLPGKGCECHGLSPLQHIMFPGIPVRQDQAVLIFQFSLPPQPGSDKTLIPLTPACKRAGPASRRRRWDNHNSARYLSKRVPTKRSKDHLLRFLFGVPVPGLWPFGLPFRSYSNIKSSTAISSDVTISLSLSLPDLASCKASSSESFTTQISTSTSSACNTLISSTNFSRFLAEISKLPSSFFTPYLFLIRSSRILSKFSSSGFSFCMFLPMVYAILTGSFSDPSRASAGDASKICFSVSFILLTFYLSSLSFPEI